MGQKDLPLASGEEHARTFERLGWVRRKAKNHIILTKEGEQAVLSVPNHAEVKRAVLQKLARAAGVTDAEYAAAFRK